MTLNPVETLNVFDPGITNELKNRRKSTNLVKTRAPFVRFTTAADMRSVSDIFAEENSPQEEREFAVTVLGTTSTVRTTSRRRGTYDACKFFTLGLHGWDNNNYTFEDIYGPQANKALSLGVTYTRDDANTYTIQQLVRTPKPDGKILPKNYPPPGITSAKVERVRNGNVLRITIETQCYTQQQLEILDLISYVPGMTCFFEWGSVETTPSGTKKLSKTIDFLEPSFNNYVKQLLLGKISRQRFISDWCAPNQYNYDWAVANIANVKTRLENNVYKTTIVAYGRADNLLYISAYATQNDMYEKAGRNTGVATAEDNIVKSIQQYFRSGGVFSSKLRQAIATATDTTSPLYNKIFRFNDPSAPGGIRDVLPAASETNKANDLGQEDVFFIKFGTFINEFLNKDVLGIVNSDKIVADKILQPLVNGNDVIYCGYNEHLRSTSIDTMIINNPRAVTLNSARPNDTLKSQALQDAFNATNRETLFGGSQPALRPNDTQLTTQQSTVKTIIDTSKFELTNGSENPSGAIPLDNGVWLNTKLIQQSFLNARTIMEGMEVLLNRVNAATENYWDLSIFYDDDAGAFRILDNNLRDVSNTPPYAEIYEFNKPLNALDDAIVGPDVLEIDISTDYPKMMFSQLAVAGINGGSLGPRSLISNPQRRDVDFKIGRAATDIFATEPATVTTPVADVAGDRSGGAQRSPGGGNSTIEQTLTNLFGARPSGAGGVTNARSETITVTRLSLEAAFTEGIVLPEFNALLRGIFSINSLINENQATGIITTIQNIVKNTDQGSATFQAMQNILFVRLRQLVIRLKQKEVRDMTIAVNNALKTDLEDLIDPSGLDPNGGVIKILEKSIAKSGWQYMQLITRSVSMPEGQLLLGVGDIKYGSYNISYFLDEESFTQAITGRDLGKSTIG